MFEHWAISEISFKINTVQHSTFLLVVRGGVRNEKVGCSIHLSGTNEFKENPLSKQ
jgi:hypothetical protein